MSTARPPLRGLVFVVVLVALGGECAALTAVFHRIAGGHRGGVFIPALVPNDVPLGVAIALAVAYAAATALLVLRRDAVAWLCCTALALGGLVVNHADIGGAVVWLLVLGLLVAARARREFATPR